MPNLDHLLLRLYSRIDKPSANAVLVFAFFVMVGGTAFGLERMGWWPAWLHTNFVPHR